MWTNISFLGIAVEIRDWETILDFLIIFFDMKNPILSEHNIFLQFRLMTFFTKQVLGSKDLGNINRKPTEKQVDFSLSLVTM